LILDLARSKEDRAVLQFTSSSASIGRHLLAPPGIPSDRLVALRRAFDAVVKDPGFVASAAKGKMDVKPVSGPELERIVKETIAASPSIIDRVRKAVQGD
jgi:tripartite-type tricarboxylate transporter receptor subunit TctC